MNDDRLQRMLDADLEGRVPSAEEVARAAALEHEMMRGTNIALIDPSEDLEVKNYYPPHLHERLVDQVDREVKEIAMDIRAADPDATVGMNVVIDSHCTIGSWDEPCQSGPNDWAPEGRVRDRSANKAPYRKWKVRGKAKAARKARKAQR